MLVYIKNPTLYLHKIVLAFCLQHLLISLFLIPEKEIIPASRLLVICKVHWRQHI